MSESVSNSLPNGQSCSLVLYYYPLVHLVNEGHCNYYGKSSQLLLDYRQVSALGSVIPFWGVVFYLGDLQSDL